MIVLSVVANGSINPHSSSGTTEAILVSHDKRGERLSLVMRRPVAITSNSCESQNTKCQGFKRITLELDAIPKRESSVMGVPSKLALP